MVSFLSATAQLKQKNRWISQDGNCLNAVNFVQRSLSQESELMRQYKFEVLFSAQEDGSFYHALLKVNDLTTKQEYVMDVTND